MKTNTLKPVILTLFLTVYSLCFVLAQDTTASNKSTVKDWVANKDFVFVAQTAIPMGRPLLQLTSEYILSISGDTITSFLPYFGRSFVAPVNPAEGGIKFTSTNAEYEQTPKRKNGWNINIRPHDVPDVRQLRLDVFTNGSATLQVTSTNRQLITFHGYVRNKERKRA